MNINVIDYLCAEVHRQGANALAVAGMARAWQYANEGFDGEGDRGLTHILCRLAGFVNGEVVQGEYFKPLRTSHVGFLRGGRAAQVQDVAPILDRLGAADRLYFVFDNDEVDQFCKSILDVHPFTDGNGRVVSILRNWMLDTLDCPTPLPYYYPA